MTMSMSLSRIFSGLGTFACTGAVVAQPLPLSLNLTTAYADTKAAMLAGDADIVCIGDRLTFRPGAYFPFLSQRMRAKYGDGGEGFRAISPWTGSAFDPGWNFGFINTDNFPFRGFDGLWAGVLATQPTLCIASSFSARARLYYLTQPGGGTFSVDRFNFPTTYIGTNATQSGLGVATLDFSVISQSGMRIRPYPGQPTDLEEAPGEQQRPVEQGPFILYGVNWQSCTPGVRLHRAANGGWGVENFIRRDQSFTLMLQDINPDLFIIMLGQNDGRLSPEQFASRLNVLVDRLQADVPAAEFVLVSTYNSGSPPVFALGDAVHEVARQRGLGFINLRDAGGSYQSYVNRGYIDPDMLHFSDAGGRFVSNLIYDSLETGGASLSARCNDIDFNNNNVFPEDRDVIDFFDIIAGTDCPTEIGNLPGCDSIDFNRNGVFPEDQDVIDFFSVLAGSEC